jgi:signal transduction histidine kinase
LSRRLVASFLTLVVLVLVVLEVPLGYTYSVRERDRLRTEIEREAVVLSTLVEDGLQHESTLDRGVIDRFVAQTRARVVVVDRAGLAVIDSDPPSKGTRSFATRPEFRAALSGHVATGTRSSATLDDRFMYVAVPVASAGTVFGAVRVTVSTKVVDDRVRRYLLTLLGVAVVSLVAAAAVALVIARSVSRPLRRLQLAAAAIGRGELGARAGPDVGPPAVRAVARAFDDMAARVEDLVTAQDAFVADASHQLRNPLAALRLRIENIGAEVPAAARDDVDAALDEVARLSRLVDGLLALARADRSGVPSAGAVDVAELLEERSAAWAALAEERDLALEVHADERPLLALVTPDRFGQAIDNLVANALDAAPRGSTIVLAGRRFVGGIEVHVIDEGPGMSSEERARAFDRFWSGRETSVLGGSGLGLSIVRKLVVADGGEVRLDESPAGGVDAVIRLRVP